MNNTSLRRPRRRWDGEGDNKAAEDRRAKKVAKKAAKKEAKHAKKATKKATKKAIKSPKVSRPDIGAIIDSLADISLGGTVGGMVNAIAAAVMPAESILIAVAPIEPAMLDVDEKYLRSLRIKMPALAVKTAVSTLLSRQ
jgi:hypothetical protein